LSSLKLVIATDYKVLFNNRITEHLEIQSHQLIIFLLIERPYRHLKTNLSLFLVCMDFVSLSRVIISKKNSNLFESWNQSDPVDEWECERSKRIEEIQGNRNEVVMGSC
jgi:hypothetical protein